MKSLFWRVIGLSIGISLIVGAVFAVNNAQGLIDWWRLREYEPSKEIVALATNSGMSDHGRRLFYVSNPQILDKSAFQDSCTVGEETIVLGCYVSTQNIYLYDVNDKRLEGVEEVTAAHEMLHAAYDRLGANEKDELSKLLNEAYDRNEDERFRKTIATYRERDDSVVLNELHSILGTEVRGLPKDLEAYYEKYFSNRSKVVGLAEAYAEAFSEREKQIEAYDAQLTRINGEITRREAELKVRGDQLQAERARIEKLRNDPEAFNAAVVSYNASVNAYNQDISEVKALVESYNAIVKKRNKIAVEERDLVEAIDTRAEQQF